MTACRMRDDIDRGIADEKVSYDAAHSNGGTLITRAGTNNRVAAPVYIAALAPDETETSQSQRQKFPVTDVFSHIEVADGRIW